MMPSPRSSLSSFRDYCPPTPENQVEFSQQTSITLGYRNFLLNKLFRRIKNRLEELQYWSQFQAFRIIQMSTINCDENNEARRKLASVLAKFHPSQSRMDIKRKALITMISNTRDAKIIEEIFCAKLCPFLQKKLQEIKGYSFHQINNAPFRKEPQINKDHAKFLLKLSRAQFSIVVRNIIMNKLSQFFEAVRYGSEIKNMKDSQKTNKQKTFTKQKKDKHHEHKVDTRMNKLVNFIHLHTLIKKKIDHNTNLFWLRFRKEYREKSPKKDQFEQQNRDFVSTMNCIVQHMIYITGRLTHRSETKQNANKQALKMIKLKNIILSNRIKQRTILNNCLCKWRMTVYQMNAEIDKQIERLQQLKRQYEEQS